MAARIIFATLPDGLNPLSLFDKAFDPIWVGPLTISPTVGTTAQGLVVTQTGPATSVVGPFIYNLISITNPTTVTTAGLINGMANFEARGFHVEMIDTSGTTVAAAGTFHMVCNSGTPSGDKVAVIANAFTSKSINGFLLGLDAVVSVGTGGSTPFLVSAQFETAFLGGTATNRLGIEITNDTSAQATNFDAAIAIDNVGTTAGAYFNGLSFGSPANLAPALDPAGNCITVQQALTVADFAHCANLTITGNILSFPNVVLAGGSGGVFSNSLTLTNNVNLAATGVSLSNNSNGTGAYSQFQAANGTGNTMTAGIGGTSALPAIYTGRPYITGNGAALVVGTSTNNPLLFIMAGAEVGRFSPTSGGFSVGTQSDPGVGQIYINSASFLMRNRTSWTNNAAAQTATLTNSPTSGNPTRWIPIDDNGTTRNIPAW